jgi:Fic family protein
LEAEREYWLQVGSFFRRVLEILMPIPLLALYEDGSRIVEALHWLERNCRNAPLTEDIIRHYHRLAIPNKNGLSGKYRMRNASVKGSNIPRPHPHRIPALMRRLESKLRAQQARFDSCIPREDEVMTSAVEAHQQLVLIHPFTDGNGRVARLAMNHMLRRYGCGYVILPPISVSKEHHEALETAHRGDLTRLVALAKNCYYRV